MADELCISLEEVLGKAQVEQGADLLREGLRRRKALFAGAGNISRCGSACGATFPGAVHRRPTQPRAEP